MEVIDDKSKIESLLPQMKRIIGDIGLVTIHEVHALWDRVLMTNKFTLDNASISLSICLIDILSTLTQWAKLNY